MTNNTSEEHLVNLAEQLHEDGLPPLHIIKAMREQENCTLAQAKQACDIAASRRQPAGDIDD